MLRYIIFIVFCFVLSGFSFAQSHHKDDKAFEVLENRGEVYFSFVKPTVYSLSWLSDQMSIDRYDNDTIFAYANSREFNRFLQLNIQYTLLTPPSLLIGKIPALKNTSADLWQSYPSYSRYIEMMENFAATYPGFCSLAEIGVSIGGKRIFAVKISDNAVDDETEPRVFYSSTMHGDEPAGFVLMLRLIDHLLSRYPEDEKIAFLIDNAEVYINPLANPDGLYFLSDTSIVGAKRGNLNSIDLNRDFPDPENGSRTMIQPETWCMMNFMTDRKFVLSANFHGGAEVVNYPWDRWERRHADNDWYIKISREYADTAHLLSKPGYMTGLDNGITNGFDWYQVTHGRQDYVNYYLHGREVTIELSKDKIPLGFELEQLWDYNKNSLVNYLVNCFKGISGVITASNTGAPLKARVFIENHDRDNSHVFSDSVTGVFYRLLSEGDYSLIAAAPGYIPKQLQVTVPGNGLTEIDIVLIPSGSDITVYPNPFTAFLNIYFSEQVYQSEVEITMTDLTGRVVMNKNIALSGREITGIETGYLKDGLYILKISTLGLTKTFKLIKKTSQN